jgi:PAS domain S-box-containing protein
MVASGATTALSKRALVHELRVHQVELEQQNEELRRAHVDLAAARDRFIDLFDFAPVSYLTLDRGGRIVEANLTAAEEFATTRDALLGSPFVRFVARSDSDRWQRLAGAAFRRGDLRRTQLLLLREGGQAFHAQLDCRRVVRSGSKPQLRLTLSDASQRELAERNRRIAAMGSIARESERREVAGELHENLAQRLVALKMTLGALTVRASEATHQSLADSMAAEIDEALALVRRLTTDLHPLMLENLGLGAALQALIDTTASGLGLAAELHVEENVESADKRLAIAVYRLTEVALEHFARRVTGGITVELLRRPRDWVLQFQSVPGHDRPGATWAESVTMPENFRDQVHLLNGRIEYGELSDEARRITVFIGTSPVDAEMAQAPRDDVGAPP